MNLAEPLTVIQLISKNNHRSHKWTIFFDILRGIFVLLVEFIRNKYIWRNGIPFNWQSLFNSDEGLISFWAQVTECLLSEQ